MKILVQKFAFDTSRNPPEYCEHIFAAVDGGFEHYTDGTLRAQVPEVSVTEYLSSRNLAQVLDDAERLIIAEAFSDL